MALPWPRPPTAIIRARPYAHPHRIRAAPVARGGPHGARLLASAAAALAGADARSVADASRRAPGGARRARDRGTHVDGDVLADPAWAAVTALTGFWQIAPDAGAPASQPTEVRILFTDDTLYFGIVCRDAEPGGIVVNESRRDSELTETDSFQIILDTYRDRQNGFVFGTNPAGLEYDGQVTNEGEGGGVTPGLGSSLGGFNKNWDASWTVRTRSGRLRLERGVRDPVLDAALRPRQGARLGPQLPAQHPAPQRAVVLGPAAAPVQPVPPVARRDARRPRAAARSAT